MQSRHTWIRIFVALVAVIGAIGVIAAAFVWIYPSHQKKSSIADKFRSAALAFSIGEYEDAAEIIRPIAEAGDVNAQFNLAVAFNRIAGANGDERLKWWCLAALQGDAEAQNHLGTMIYNKDKNEAAFWLKHAAENGDADAQHRMAWDYHFGMEVERDDKKGLQLLHDAAKNGDDSAQFDLGNIYFDGKGNADPPWTQVTQDYAESAKWYLAAAQRGNSLAQRQIGLMYYGGLGVVQDYAQAYFWLNLALADPTLNKMGGGDPSLSKALGFERQIRDKAASHLTTERLDRTQELLTKWQRVPSIDKFFPDWRKHPAPESGDKRGITDLFAGSVCSRWDVSSQTKPR
jgi:hypothetical protein